MRVVWWIVGIVLLVLVGIGGYVWLESDKLLRNLIEKYGSAYLGTEVSVSGVELSLTEGSARVHGVVVQNPPGFSGPPAFRLSEIGVTLDTGQISSELVVLKQVVVDGAEVAALARGSELNLKQLLDHLNAEIAARGPAEETGVESEVKLIIDRFRFSGARLTAQSDLLGAGEVTLPDIQLSDVGRQSNGATVGQVLRQVLQPIYRAAMEEMLRRGVDLEGARDRIEQNVRDKVQQQIKDKVGGGVDGLLDKLDGKP